MTSITLFFIFIPFLALILLAINFIFAPHSPYQEKVSPFECGFHSFLGQNRTQFSISFFIFALLFLLFDLEILLVYPYVVSAYANSIYGLIIMLIFFLALTLGFTFELGKNALKLDSRQYDLINLKRYLTLNASNLSLVIYKEKNDKFFYLFIIIIGLSIFFDLYSQVTHLINLILTIINNPEAMLIVYLKGCLGTIFCILLKNTKYFILLKSIYIELEKNDFELLFYSLRWLIEYSKRGVNTTVNTISTSDIIIIAFSFIFILFIDLWYIYYTGLSFEFNTLFFIYSFLCIIYLIVYIYFDKGFKDRNPFLFQVFCFGSVIILIGLLIKELVSAYLYIKGSSSGSPHKASGTQNTGGNNGGPGGGGPDLSPAAGTAATKEQNNKEKEKMDSEMVGTGQEGPGPNSNYEVSETLGERIARLEKERKENYNKLLEIESNKPSRKITIKTEQEVQEFGQVRILKTPTLLEKIEARKAERAERAAAAAVTAAKREARKAELEAKAEWADIKPGINVGTKVKEVKVPAYQPDPYSDWSDRPSPNQAEIERRNPTYIQYWTEVKEMWPVIKFLNNNNPSPVERGKDN